MTKQFAAGQALWPATVNNVTYYGIDLRLQFGLVAATWLLLSVAAFLLFPSLRRRREDHLYPPGSSRWSRYCFRRRTATFVTFSLGYRPSSSWDTRA